MSRLVTWMFAAIGLALAGQPLRAGTEAGGRPFQFRMPLPTAYWTVDNRELARTASAETQWLKVQAEQGSTHLARITRTEQMPRFRRTGCCAERQSDKL